MSYRIVTIANRRPHEYYYTFDEFFKSLQGEQVTVLGSHPGEYGGLGSKPRLLYNAIKGGVFPEKYLIFCDCFDLVFAVKPKQLFYEYLNFQIPVMISAEKNCFPNTYKEEYDKKENHGSPYRYLNSGMVVGETEAILAILESMDAANIPNDYWDTEKNCQINPNDQEYYQHEFLKQPVKIELDYGQVLCNTLHDVELSELDFSHDRIANKTTASYPCSFHLNGASKTGPCREPILKHLKLL